jgi:hypothetical protein
MALLTKLDCGKVLPLVVFHMNEGLESTVVLSALLELPLVSVPALESSDISKFKSLRLLSESSLAPATRGTPISQMGTVLDSLGEERDVLLHTSAGDFSS